MFVLLYQIRENLSPFVQTDTHSSGRVTDLQIVWNRFGREGIYMWLNPPYNQAIEKSSVYF